MVLQENSFQTVIDSAFPKLEKHKRKGWPKFPVTLDSMVLQNSTHVDVLGKYISTMNLGEALRRMHDPKAYLASLFAHERDKFHYAHEDLPDDCMYRATVDFREALGKIIDPDVKAHVFKF